MWYLLSLLANIGFWSFQQGRIYAISMRYARIISSFVIVGKKSYALHSEEELKEIVMKNLQGVL